MRIIKVPDIEHLLFEIRHMSRYIEEEFLFKVGLSFHAGRSDARKLKSTSKVPEPPAPTSKWSRLGIELTDVLNEWNSEFVKIKYLQEEFKQKYDHKTKEAKVLEEELRECRTKLASTMQSISLQNRQADQHQIDLAEA
ncbi:hypothetical protein IEQ34_005728 [Dendrobium chrysotoxum]|uniref:Uncharacterized protein n=1 Tax=Dendrobium chrysotoxum TaxID=161865 RepID=A0AAV7HBX5_DENCH|nr:hypothetical protein IEQ34_005728 [Dendrobium chrysotoxum]